MRVRKQRQSCRVPLVPATPKTLTPPHPCSQAVSSAGRHPILCCPLSRLFLVARFRVFGFPLKHCLGGYSRRVAADRWRPPQFLLQTGHRRCRPTARTTSARPAPASCQHTHPRSRVPTLLPAPTAHGPVSTALCLRRTARTAQDAIVPPAAPASRQPVDEARHSV